MAEGYFVSHLECSVTGERHGAGEPHGLSRAGAPLLVRYDLRALGAALDRDAVAARPADMWRFRELLPLPPGRRPVSLGESETPLVPLAAGASGAGVLVKDEGRLPTGSFKARGLAVAVTMAVHFGAARVALPSAGEAGAAAAAYAARGGLEAFVFTAAGASDAVLAEIEAFGARVTRVDGPIEACAARVRGGALERGWRDLSALAEPYRLEGEKTMGLELALQLGWDLPDAVYYPTGTGTGFVGLWKAFDELAALGWIGAARPRMVAVQARGCAPVVRAWESGAESVAEPWAPVTTRVAGLRVARPPGDRLILSVIRDSGGHAVAVDDAEVWDARAEAARSGGLLLCPEGAACLAALRRDLAAGLISADARVVLFNTAAGFRAPPRPSDGGG
ncbi:MAG: threonine synthase [Hyphomicrobiales bacterium]|nr:threonine synthase [Hyphomicrobiales bacterium]